MERDFSGVPMGNKSSTVLIVENNENYRLMLKETLEALGCRILEATGRADALLLMENRPPNLVIMDMRLVNDEDSNDTSGLKLMREFPQNIPVIILTAHTDAKVIQASYETIPDVPKPWAYLFKGDGVEAIRARVQEALRAQQPSAKPWYKERTFIVVAVIAGTIIIGGGLYLEFKKDGPLILGILAIGVLIEVVASFVVNLFNRGK
jgi:CheY-like chemotaxis protein